MDHSWVKTIGCLSRLSIAYFSQRMR